MNWHIGQEIVCIKTHPEGIVKRGKIYTIKGLTESQCKCQGVQIDVGATYDSKFYTGRSQCLDCGWLSSVPSEVWWFSERRFAPLEYNQDAINELLEEPVLISLPAL
jgi:hypothetical protein